MQKFSSFGRKKKQTKIRHRMVMLEDLQVIHCELRDYSAAAVLRRIVNKLALI